MNATTATASVLVDRPRHRVWEALTDPKLISQYFMGAKVSTDWKVGHPITFTGTWKDKPYEDKGEIMSFTPEDEMTYSHWSPLSGTEDKPDNYHIVHIELTDVEHGTRVALEQSNLSGEITEADRASRGDYEKNWTSMLEGLKSVAES
jgi:uncharacterized protein YndB with AHSA1/START domain